MYILFKLLIHLTLQFTISIKYMYVTPPKIDTNTKMHLLKNINIRILIR